MGVVGGVGLGAVAAVSGTAEAGTFGAAGLFAGLAGCAAGAVLGAVAGTGAVSFADIAVGFSAAAGGGGAAGAGTLCVVAGGCFGVRSPPQAGPDSSVNHRIAYAKRLGLDMSETVALAALQR